MLNIKNIKEDTNGFIETVVKFLIPQNKIEQIERCLSIQNHLTSDTCFEKGKIEVYEDGIRIYVEGLRNSFSIFLNNDLQPARKKRGSKLIEKIDLDDIRKVDFEKLVN